jgi:type II secretory pathway pseudopilin PulG
LVELMIAVAIIGIMAAIALPTFMNYKRRARTSEVPDKLKTLYIHATAYYQGHRASGLMSMVGSCTVEATAGTIPATPMGDPQPGNFSADPSFRALGLPSIEHLYYGYGVDSVGDMCANARGIALYTFYAEGDLDDDSMLSRFELAVGSDTQNELYRAPGFYVQDELE